MLQKKILVCDDLDILDITSMLLEAEDFKVIIQSNCNELIPQAIAEKPDLMLIDLWMPILPGDQLTKDIKCTPSIAHVPIIIFSAAVEGKRMAIDAGAEGFIENPFDIVNLCDKINQLLSVNKPLS